MAEKIILQKSCDDESKLEFSNLRDSFNIKYSLEPDFYIRVPGRVNLIGEHIDYCGYSVLPMAIKQSVIAAVKSIDEPDIKLSNVEESKYKDYSSKIDNIEIEIKANYQPAWYDYILCGFKGILEIVKEQPIHGIIIHVASTLPSGAGLSSSSAIVCTAMLGLNIILKTDLSYYRIAELAAQAEHYIGTEGGGMDQAIIFNGKKGSASYVSFNPLTLMNIKIPSNGTFVIAQSMITKNKAASNDFNSRVVECRLSSLMIAKRHFKNWDEFMILAKLQKELKYNFEQLKIEVENIFHDNDYTKDEICKYLEITAEELEDRFLTKNTKHLNSFKLKLRILHVVNEASRVQEFCEICKTSKSISKLGNLLSESHSSLKNLYECSHPQLDQLVTCCLTNGALGARLTGAGWGGCIVALVSGDKVNAFVNAIKAHFYHNKVSLSTNMDELVFVTKAEDGATAFDKSILRN